MIIEWFTPARRDLEWFGETAGTLATIERQGISAVASVVGARGQSAYEVWLSEGNTGTEAEFLESLKSETDIPNPPDILDFVAAVDAALN